MTYDKLMLKLNSSGVTVAQVSNDHDLTKLNSSTVSLRVDSSESMRNDKNLSVNHVNELVLNTNQSTLVKVKMRT